MTKEDLETVMRAVETLDRVNKKYGMPHGKNPIGIVFYAYGFLQKATEEERRDKETEGAI